MTQIVTGFIFIALVKGVIYADELETNLDCEKRNAVTSVCATNCEIDRCPETEHYSRVCDRQVCGKGCQCRFNEKFDANGTCVPTQLCPPFTCSRPHEVFNACPSYCGDDCSSSCLFQLLVVECLPACRCQSGFKKKDGVCVPQEQCKRR